MKTKSRQEGYLKKATAISILLCLILIGKINCFSQAQSSLLFADRLFAKGEFYRAITEYERVLFFDCQNLKDSSYCIHQIIKAYYKGEEYDNAISYIRSIRKHVKKDNVGISKFDHYMGLCYLKLEMYEFALYYFEKQPELPNSIVLAGISNMYIQNWDTAQIKFKKVIDSNDLSQKELAGILLDFCTTGRKAGRKNPYVAGSLSLIPGLGYLYTKHYQSALSAFTLNSLLLGSSYEFRNRGYKAVSITTQALAITWYMGNIYGSIASAKRVNEKSEREFLEGIFREYPALLNL